VTYRDTLTALAGATEEAAVNLYLRHEAGEVTDDGFDAYLAAVVSRANGRAAAVADLGLAAAVTVALRRPVAPLGIVPPASDPDRLRRAARTLREALDDTPDPSARVARLGRSEPLTAAANAYSTGMSASPHVTGWTRGLSAKACQLCQWWARGGRVFRADHPMPTHKGCTCTPIPTIR